jgi:wyosine [tRNA(Phe)-imidazoG37] synthetase (radical SAM superfamily)
LPEGSKIFTLPRRFPVGYDEATETYVPLTIFNIKGKRFRPLAVSAFMPPAYLRLLLPASVRMTNTPTLPQWAYTMIAGKGEDFYVAGSRVDPSERWQPQRFDDRDLTVKIAECIKTAGDNRLIRHIANCATVYHCFAAKNFFLGRWEAPLPLARRCNASCLGCLSLQTGETPASHQRIDFTPTAEEIAEVATLHLENAEDPMVSFGQGCEGDPILDWELVVRAVKLIRSRTSRGTIHINTNGSIPEAVPHLAQAGLDSIRISMNSARKINYERYFRPEGYSFEKVIESIKSAKDYGLFVHINLLIMPGFSDTQPEIEALVQMVQETFLDLVQLKNLNLDPDLYLNAMQIEAPSMGMLKMLENLRQELPELRFGYFNLQRERFYFKNRC